MILEVQIRYWQMLGFFLALEQALESPYVNIFKILGKIRSYPNLVLTPVPQLLEDFTVLPHKIPSSQGFL